MKRGVVTSLSLLGLSLFIFTMSGCGSSSVDKAMISVEDGQTKVMEISEQLMNGEITNEEAEKKIEEITKKMESWTNALKDYYKTVSDFDGIPKRAKNLGAYELKWFDIIENDSSITEFSKKDHLPESMSLVYSYDDEAKAIEVAEKLADSMGIEESTHSPRKLQKQLEETMQSMLEYMSDEEKAEYEKNKMSGYIADQSKWDYYIMISVLDGKISIIINNNKQMQEILE